MEASYQQFSGDPDDSEETPQEFGAMIHIVPESGKCEYKQYNIMLIFQKWWYFSKFKLFCQIFINNSLITHVNKMTFTLSLNNNKEKLFV